MHNVMLAKRYESQDVTGWFMSEKLDGVRAVWDGTRLLSRNAKEIHAPEWFKNLLPTAMLDGELCVGRGGFEQTVSVVRKKIPISDEWKTVTYNVFDTILSSIPFSKRYAHLLSIPKSEVWSPVTQVTCLDMEHLLRFYTDLLGIGAEGIMLRDPSSLYEFKRSNFLLKLKPSISDEAIVTGYQVGEGKYVNIMGALLCNWNGKSISIGTGFSDVERTNPPAIGSTVTFKYSNLTSYGEPRFPVFVCIRDYE